MRVNPAITVRSLLALLAGLAVFACFGAADRLAAEQVRQPTAIQFYFDRPIDASAAPFVLAAADGLFGSEGLAVTTHLFPRLDADRYGPGRLTKIRAQAVSVTATCPAPEG